MEVVRAPVANFTLSLVAVLGVIGLPLAKSEASFIGYLEQISPAPQVYTPGVDFLPFSETSGLVAVDDVSGFLQAVPGFGSTPADFAGFTAGNIALIERGEVTFSTKVNLAADAGAIGVLIFNQLPGGPVQGALTESTTIPAVNITQSLGQQLLAQLAGGAVEIRLSVQPVPEPATIVLAMSGVLVAIWSQRGRLRASLKARSSVQPARRARSGSDDSNVEPAALRRPVVRSPGSRVAAFAPSHDVERASHVF